MAKKVLTGGDGVSGQTGEEFLDDINENFTELYTGQHIDQATAAELADDDELGFWQKVGSTLKKITWANLVLKLQTLFEAKNSNIQTHIGTTTTPHVTSSEKSTWNGKEDAGTAAGLMSSHTSNHPAPTNRDTRNEAAGTASGLMSSHTSTYDHSKLADVDAKLPKAQPAGSGSAIVFTQDRSYGSIASPEAGNITADLTDAVHGAVVLVIHQNATEPTYPGTFQKLSGSEDYNAAKVNLIYIQYLDATNQKYTIAYDE